MDADQVPDALPATVIRPRPLIMAVMTQSLTELGPASRTALAWQWVLTGHGPAPVSGTPGTGSPPTDTEITAEARQGTDSAPPECGWPPWRYARDPDPDRQQARRVLHWLTGAADAIPLFDPGCGRHVGDTPMSALSRRHSPLDPVTNLAHPEPAYPLADLISISGAGCGVTNIDGENMVYLDIVIMQGHEGQPPAEPDRHPPPQWGEGVQQVHDWATGEDQKPPADHHGCGDYHPCPANADASAKPPGTASAAGAQRAPSTSAAPHGQRSSRPSNLRHSTHPAI